MSTTAKAIREERAGLIQEMNEMTSLVAKENRSFTSEETEKFDRIDRAQQELLNKAETLERVERSQALVSPERSEAKVQTSVSPKQISRSDINKAYKAWFCHGNRNYSNDCPELHRREYNAAADKAGLNIYSNKFNLEFRAQDETNSGGGYTIQNSPMQALEVALKAYGGMLKVADVITTSSGSLMQFPCVNDTANVGEIIGINTQVNEQDLTFSQKTLGAYTYSSKQILVPLELAQDNSVNLVDYVGNALGVRLGRILNTHFTVGDGSSKPRGILTDAALGVTAEDTNWFSWETLIGLIHSVDPAYRSEPGVGFMVHDSTWALMKQIADSQNRPLWLPSLAAGAPDTFAGYPVYVNQDMPTVAANAKVALFGSFKHYKIRRVADIEITRVNELYAAYHQIGFFGYGRFDGSLIFNSGSCPVAYMQMAASGTH